MGIEGLQMREIEKSLDAMNEYDRQELKGELMNKKKVIVILMILFLPSCFYQKVDKSDLIKAEEFCKDKGGINYINAYAIGAESVKCINREILFLKIGE